MQLSPPAFEHISAAELSKSSLHYSFDSTVDCACEAAFHDLMVDTGVKSCFLLAENSCVITSELFKPQLSTNNQLM